MVERKVRIVNKLGLHLRAAALLVQTASSFKSEIRIRNKNIEVDAKSIMGVLGLEAALGTEVILRAKGPDQEEALSALAALVEAKFNEGE